MKKKYYLINYHSNLHYS